MDNLKLYLIAIILIFPSLIIAQELECCKSEKDIENTITGYWKIKDDNSKSLYHFWFENGRGNVETVQTTETVGKYIHVDKSHSYIYIKKEDDFYILEYIYKYGKWTSIIKQLDSNNLVLETNAENTAYYKIKY